MPPLARVRAAVTSPGPREVGRRGLDTRGAWGGGDGPGAPAARVPCGSQRLRPRQPELLREGPCLGWLCSACRNRARSGSA